ncbi:MAG: hypothetical protein JW746_05695 [Candidatus Krumholzibacteriota bacterium]|nr:hypothetical protein [Candidatus Krumholzibacteriota bacterium]
MRMLTKVFLLAIALMIFSSAQMVADGLRGIPVDKIVSRTEASLVAFEGTVYKIYNSDGYYIFFEKVDDAHNRVHIMPVERVRPFVDVCIQWDAFSPVCLDIDPDGDNSYLLGTETGYAEK